MRTTVSLAGLFSDQTARNRASARPLCPVLLRAPVHVLLVGRRGLREVRQGEGCEQGDPLAPALFALGQHDALVGAAASPHPYEELAAFLDFDDVYVVTTSPGARRALDTVTGAIAAHCGIAANLGGRSTLQENPRPAT